MKRFIPLAALGFASVVADLPNINVKDFTQDVFDNRVDHFDYLNIKTYEQRFWNNAKYWDAVNGPVLVYICGEYTCSVPANRLYPFQLGADLKANMFVLEHRFYGASQVTYDWKTPSLKLLSAEQALADLAYFIEMTNDAIVQQHGGQPRQWIVVGGSYPGALSAWFQAKYPHLSVLSWSSSGVINAIEDFTDFDKQIYTAT